MEQGIDRYKLWAFGLLGSITILSVLIAMQTRQYYIMLAPFLIMTVYTAVINFKALYYLLLIAIPFSIEYNFSPTLGTDLPDEPLMIGLMLVTIVFIATNYKSLPTGYFFHLLVIALVLHIFWIFIATLHSTDFIVSLKVFLAKVWYVVTFSFLSAIVLRTKEDYKTAFWCVFIPLTLLTIQVMVRQAMQGFSFDDVNRPMTPFFRNHVNYAAILSVFFPFILRAYTWYGPWTYKRIAIALAIPVYLAAIYLSYTRTTYIAIFLIIPIYLVVRYRLMKLAVGAAAIGVTAMVIFFFHQNHYLEYAPSYKETIYHDDFGQHLSSTFEGKDVSSMERIYRWVAAARMFQDQPVFGFGPGNFYPNYMKYTVSSFETYVSDNPERSTTHNYPLLLLTEQGIVGLAIFIFLTGVIFIYGERVYHRIKNPDEKKIAMTLIIVLGMVYVNILLSDLLESDKVGPFFFMCISLLAALDIRSRVQASKEAEKL